MKQAETVIHCIVGNSGECPPDCQLHKHSKGFSQDTVAAGLKFDPEASRRALLFADARNHTVNVVDIANVLASCLLEPKAKPEEIKD